MTPAMLSRPRKWLIVSSLLLTAFLYTLSVKGSILESDLLIQAAQLDRYSVQSTLGPAAVMGLSAIFTSIYLIQIFGPRRVFLIGVLCLTAGSFGTAFINSGWQYAVSMLVRTCASMILIPTLTILQRTVPGQARYNYCSFLALVYAGQVAAEPLGALLAFAPSWRALFLGIGTGGLCVMALGLLIFPDDRPTTPPAYPFDYAGAGLFTTGVGLAIFLLYRGNYLGWWVSRSISLAIFALPVVIGLFIWREMSTPGPFLSVRAFAFRTVTLTLCASLCWAGALYGFALMLPRFLLVVGYEHWKTGWVMMPMSLAVVAAMLLGAFMHTREQFIWVLRFALAGMTISAHRFAQTDQYVSWQFVMAWSIPWGICAGLCTAPLAQLAMEGQRPAEGSATGPIKFFMRGFGAALGVLIASLIVERGAASGLEYVRTAITAKPGILQSVDPHIRDHLHRHGSAEGTSITQSEGVIASWVMVHAQVIGYRAAFRFCAYLSAVAFLFSCCIGNRSEINALDDV